MHYIHYVYRFLHLEYTTYYLCIIIFLGEPLYEATKIPNPSLDPYPPWQFHSPKLIYLLN